MTDTLSVALIDPAFIIVGIVLLYFGAEGLIRGAYRTSVRLGLSPLVAGLTVVSICTSLPEAVASFVAQVLGGYGNIAIGNVIGSNTANVGLILGISALVRPLPTARVMRNREIPIMLGVLVLLMLFMLGGDVGRIRGIIFLVLLIAYLWFQAHMGKREASQHHLATGIAIGRSAKQWVWDIVLVVVGAAVMIGGAELLVQGAVGLARAAGLSNRVIGLTIVAIGTSLPELAASTVAAYRGHADIAIGNVVGSNVFNALLIVGGVATISPISFEQRLLTVDAPVMLFLSLVFWGMLWIRPTVSRLEGGLLVALYVIYIALVLGIGA